MKNYKGITLIALVVTIVILIILAVISINFVLGENGIVGKAIKMQEIQKIAEEKEKIELAKATVLASNRGKIPANKYIEELKQGKVVTDDGIQYGENGKIQITTTNNRNLEIETDEAGNVIAISEKGQAGKQTVSIENVELTAKTNTIKIDVTVLRGEGATYKYYYKEGTGAYELAYEGSQTRYTLERLKSGTEYWVKVEVVNSYGVVSKEVLGKTKTIASGQEGAADLQKIGEYNDKFSMIELDVVIDNLGTVTEKLFIDSIRKEGTIAEENISINSNGNYELITNENYVFEVTLKSTNDIEVNYLGIVQ